MLHTKLQSGFLAALALEAAPIAKEHYKAFGMARGLKDDYTPITIADTLINKLVMDIVEAEFPEISVIGEEMSYISNGGSDYEIILDPIDGTLPFTWGHPLFTMAIALCHKGEPVSCCIYDYRQGRCFTADKGKGAFMGHTKLRVSKATFQDQPVVAVITWPAKFGTVVSQGAPCRLEEVALILGAYGAWVPNYISASYHAIAVATGEFAASLYPGNKSFDSAAADLLVREAGGMATNLLGEKLVYHGAEGPYHHLVSNGCVHDQILEAIRYVNSTEPLQLFRKR